jgi:MFS transporter, ACS family, pantothenate transporter
MCSAACRDFSQLCAVRFFQGALEASLYCGTMYLLGSWYTAAEIAKRTAIFTAIGQIGSMFAGIMMAAMQNTLDDSHGLSGWQWLYIINGASGIPFAFAGFVLLPDVPEQTKAMYLSRSEIQLALGRLPPKREDGHKINLKSLLPRIFGSRIFYIFITFSTLCGALEIFCTQGLLLLWINHFSDRFPRNAANTYPLGIQAVAITSNLLAGYYIDHTQNRLAAGFVTAILQLISTIMLMVPSLPTGGTLFAFYNSATSYIVNPLLFGWVNVIGQWEGDEALRAIILYAMNTSQSVLLTFWGVLFLPADHAPYWRRGYIAMLVVIVLFVVFLVLAQNVSVIENMSEQVADVDA